MERDSRSIDLQRIVHFCDEYFRVADLPADPAFGRFVPMVYDPIGFPWREAFEPDFVHRFNGLMIRGRQNVGKVWCVSFPADEMLDHILRRAHPGDLIFSHHPIDMECGDPRGELGRGFVPIDPVRLEVLRASGLSFYSCHVPLDIHPQLSPSDAIVRAIGGQVVEQFLPYGWGHAGRLCQIPPTPLGDVIATCQRVLELPYVDLQGQVDAVNNVISRVAVVAGGGGDVEFYREADRLGADCLIAGEVTSKIDNELGRRRQIEIEDYLPNTDLVAIGLSHAGSEYLVMTEIAPFIERHLGVPAEAVPESNWWR
jgi:putative NIF3 family GTP cyclohydrolase 1 type 2